MPLTIGTILENRYRIDALLGAGGMGAVYRAWDLRLDQVVALKENTLITEASSRQFEREAKVMAGLRHPHLPRVTDHFVLPDGAQYLVMEYIEGENLETLLERGGPLDEARALAWIGQVCDALAYLHTQRPPIIHRDIKPANIKITPKGEVFLVDFGVAKVGHDKTQTGALAVTPGFSPPEQYGFGTTDPRSDIYALGATLYTLLTGQTPPEGVQRAIQAAQLIPPRALCPTISPATAAAIEAALHTTPTERPQSVAEFQAWLHGVAAPPPVAQAATLILPDQEGVAAVPSRPQFEPAPSPHKPAPRSLPGWAWLVGVSVLVVLGILIAFSFGGKGAKPDPMPAVPTTTSVPLTTSIATATLTLEPTKTLPPTHTPTLTPTPAPKLGDVWTRPQDGMVMVFVPAGEFTMGSDVVQVEYNIGLCIADDIAKNDCTNWITIEQPTHTVTLAAFWIDQTEVTNAQYQKCMDAGVCKPSACAEDSDSNGADQPVVCVDWVQANQYAAWVGGRLPTEAEWEYAARGPEGLLYPWGNGFDGTLLNYCDKNCEQTWAAQIFDDGYARVAPVGSYPKGASWVGALDLTGNVWEWTADWFGEYTAEPQENPTGPTNGERRVARGGAFRGSGWNNRPTSRNSSVPDFFGKLHGFRTVRTVSTDQP